jgi:hypothetical protein
MTSFNADIPCPACGYNLRGLTPHHACPECGWKAPPPVLTPAERARIKQLEAEVEESLRQQEEESARRQRHEAFLAAWDRRGERLDRMLDQLEAFLRDHARGGE